MTTRVKMGRVELAFWLVLTAAEGFALGMFITLTWLCEMPLP